MTGQPDPGDAAASQRASEDPGNFKRTPPSDEVDQDPLDSGPRFTSNQLLIATVLIGSALGVILAFVYL